MLETIAIILIILWILGLVSAQTLGGFIHVLLILATIMVAIRLIRGKSCNHTKLKNPGINNH